MVVIGETKTFDFDWPDDVDRNLKYEIKFLVKSKPQNNITNKMEQLLLKYKQGNDIHVWKTEKRMNCANLF